jgi:hypothetical protein
MIMNNGFKKLREITEKINRSLVAHSGMIASYKYGNNSASFHAAGSSLT